MTDKPPMPIDAEASLLWLECKTLCYGGKSQFFPNITKAEAERIRRMGFEKFLEWFVTLEKEETPMDK
jgi:hypothetical protein